MNIDVPGRGRLEISSIVFDFNGTLAEDGRVDDTTAGLLKELGRQYVVTIVTADTFGTAAAVAQRLGVAWRRIESGRDKQAFVQSLAKGVAAVGNGVNDELMFRAAALAVCVLGPEGTAPQTLLAADIVAPSTRKALELFLHPKRIMATLRE
ncbi:MAG: haloacid dehalogenase [Thermaerobacter sp.]|nr:haloacid dehalogenase [Thermaerobacter sp.]